MRRLAHAFAAGVLVVAVAACGGDDAAAPVATTATTVATPATVAATTSTSSSSTTSSTSTTTATTTTLPTTTILTLPTPDAPPAEDGTTEPLVEVGHIEIPRIGLSSPMLEGIRLSTLDGGPGHWPGTAMPGQPGNVVVAGHRVSHNADFRHLDELAPGDEVVLSDGAGGRFVYDVTSTEIVQPDALWIVDQTPASTATLFACHPPGSVRQRIVVHLELVA